MITRGKIKIESSYLKKVKKLPYMDKPHINVPASWECYPKECLQHLEFGDKDIKNNQYEWRKQLQPKNAKCVGYLFSKLMPGNIVPKHRDHFESFSLYYNVPVESVKRRLIFLEDWKHGHYFQVNEEVFIKWSAGDWVEWTADEEHFGGNMGEEPRYILQITYC
jgi:hypothetical protein